MTENYADINAKTIDRWVEHGWEWGVPIDHATYERATRGDYGVLLTPTKPVPHEWFGDLRGKRIFGLASGGGQQMPVFAALGADCTIMDYSEKQLENEKLVSEREGYPINIIRGDMTKPFPFENESFDFIFHPVSNVYIKDVLHVWRECFRVLKKGGVLLAGLCNGLNYAFAEDEHDLENKLPFDPLTDPELYKKCVESGDGVQFSHTVEEQIGGQLDAGFTLTNIFGDTNGSGRLHEYNVVTFFATRSVKK